MKILVIDESSTVDALDVAESRAVDLGLENVNLTMINFSSRVLLTFEDALEPFFF